MSALPPIADIRRLGCDVRFVPIADRYSIYPSAAAAKRKPGHRNVALNPSQQT